jgi:hypothetical protein
MLRPICIISVKTRFWAYAVTHGVFCFTLTVDVGEFLPRFFTEFAQAKTSENPHRESPPLSVKRTIYLRFSLLFLYNVELLS